MRASSPELGVVVTGGSERNNGRVRDAANEYVLSKGWSGEAERLQLLEASVDPLSIKSIRAAGLQPGWRCLEVGAGSGSMARWLAEETGDPALVTAVDLDVRLLGPLESLGVEVLERDVVADGFPDGSFDLIHARAVLEHISAREDLLDRMTRWLRPNGALVLVDCASFPIASSHHPAYAEAMGAWVEVLAMTGTDYDWTRTFPEPLVRHGFEAVQATCMVPMMRGATPVARFWSLTLETLRERMVAAHLVASSTLDEAQRLLADDTFWDLGPGFIAAWGRRPG